MKRTIKIFAFMLALIMIFTSAACGGGKSSAGGGGEYSPYNLRWVDYENGILAFDTPRDSTFSIKEGEHYSYFVDLYRDGERVGNNGQSGTIPEYMMEFDMSLDMREPGNYYFEAYFAKYFIWDGDNPDMLGQVAVSETIYLESDAYTVQIDPETGWPLDPYTGMPIRQDLPVDPDERGNTTGNIINGDDGKAAAIKGDWIYYVNARNLYKVRVDGTEETMLIEDGVGGAVNVVGEWVYYSGQQSSSIRRVRTDGTDRTYMVECSGARCVTVIGDWIYFRRFEDNNGPAGFYKMNTAGGEQILLIEGEMTSSINVVGDRIYYISDYADGGYALSTMKTDGTEQSSIETELFPAKSVEHVVWDGGYLYILAGTYNSIEESGDRGIYRMDTDGQNMELIVETAGRLMYNFNISDGWIYYVLNTDESPRSQSLYKTNIETRETVELVSGESEYFYPNVVVVGDWIFSRFIAQGDTDSTLHRIRTDGTGEQIMMR